MNAITAIMIASTVPALSIRAFGVVPMTPKTRSRSDRFSAGSGLAPGSVAPQAAQYRSPDSTCAPQRGQCTAGTVPKTTGGVRGFASAAAGIERPLRLS
jgi:hypothetical protein